MNQAFKPSTFLLRTATAAIIVNGFLVASVPAATFHWLTDPSLVGLVTFDDFLGNDDIFASFNTIGAASQSRNSQFTRFGFLEGTHSARGASTFGPQNQLFFGDNFFQSFDITGEDRQGQPFSQSLLGPGQIIINRNQSYTTSFRVGDTGLGGFVDVTGSGDRKASCRERVCYPV